MSKQCSSLGGWICLGRSWYWECYVTVSVFLSSFLPTVLLTVTWRELAPPTKNQILVKMSLQPVCGFGIVLVCRPQRYWDLWWWVSGLGHPSLLLHGTHRVEFTHCSNFQVCGIKWDQRLPFPCWECVFHPMVSCDPAVYELCQTFMAEE